MDELFFYGYNRVDALIDDTDLDKTVKGKIRENLRAMFVAYEKQRSAAEQAKKWSAANGSSNKKQPKTND
jgi:hypothetical protein